MKNRRFIQILGSAVLIASMGITGCSTTGEKETEKETTKETTEKETTEEDEEDFCSCNPDCEAYEDEEYYCSSGDFEITSSNGSLPGQMDYMAACPDPDTLDWEAYPDVEDSYITDLSVIEDDDLRAIAQSYADQGYNIIDPVLEFEYGNLGGDWEYQFLDGFHADFVGDDFGAEVGVYKMNEDLFNYFLVEYWGLDDPDYYNVTDDGTVIRYGDDDWYVEYNRDTGIGVDFYGYDPNELIG